MAIRLEILKITVHPKGKFVQDIRNGWYDLRKLKRARVDGQLVDRSAKTKFAIYYDCGAKVLRVVTHKGSLRSAEKIGRALFHRISALTRLGTPLYFIKELSSQDSASFANDSGIDVIALLHYIRESGPIEIE